MAAQGLHGGRHALAGDPGDGGQQVGFGAAEDGQGAGHLPYVPGLPGQAVRHRGGDDSVAERAQFVHSGGVGTHSGLAQPGEQTVQQLGIAARDLGAAPYEALVRGGSQGLADDPGGGAVAERSEFHQGAAVLGEEFGEDGRAGAVAVGALGQEDEQGPGGGPAQDEIDASEGGLVAPLGVVEDEGERPFVHEAHGVAVQEAMDGVGVAGGRGGGCAAGQLRAEEGACAAAAGPGVVEAAGVVTDGDARRPQAVGDGGQQAGPADSGGAADEHGAGGAGARPGSVPDQSVELDGTADQLAYTALTCIDTDRHGVPSFVKPRSTCNSTLSVDVWKTAFMSRLARSRSETTVTVRLVRTHHVSDRMAATHGQVGQSVPARLLGVP
ncbi:hypothetical protein GCM10020000_08510 [Streptomyces olivoverticillatus]